ncbi:acyl-CoA synthetase [Novosphingobium bradum]|uniref:Acyl-CoA synthetase n=1 Tax=Novosphingobium bradum TaxID=1737444 RepID=A0ABV7IP63_9SPHN
MHPRDYAAITPDHPAVIMAGSGETMSYGQLESQANRIAHWLRAQGIERGDTIAVLMENCPEFLAICWAAQRSGLYWTCISPRLLPSEVLYIASDCAARIVFCSQTTAPLLAELVQAGLPVALVAARGSVDGMIDLPSALADLPDWPMANETQGTDLLYSSGTTGRPKGIRRPMPDGPIDQPPNLVRLMTSYFCISKGCRYLCPAPLYHAGPLRWSMGIQMLGGTVVVMEKFDPEQALALIERHGIEAGQFVPTHFTRILKLAPEIRARHDLSSLRSVVHAAAPCPAEIKRAMIDWLGPVVYEYYSSTEGNGLCAINSAEWLAHPGSVGRAFVGKLHICDEAGEPVDSGVTGQVYFEGGWPLSYHDDPEKTAASHNRHGWSTIGDIGWADAEGYLHLTDRKDYMIISGGVNIYPQEVEDRLIAHPRVHDAAIIGRPDADLGERVVAFVQPIESPDDETAFAAELAAYLKSQVSSVKVPREFVFVTELPRSETGKLNKRLLS